MPDSQPTGASSGESSEIHDASQSLSEDTPAGEPDEVDQA